MNGIKDDRLRRRLCYTVADCPMSALGGGFNRSPSLFDLARTTGFDIESLIFSFGIGGMAAVLYNLLTGRVLIAVTNTQRQAPRHKLHYWALTVPFLSFPLFYLLRWNPIYSAIAPMGLGAAVTMFCRPDLAHKT